MVHAGLSEHIILLVIMASAEGVGSSSAAKRDVEWQRKHTVSIFARARLASGWFAVAVCDCFRRPTTKQPRTLSTPSCEPAQNSEPTPNQQRTIYEPASNQARTRPEPSTNQQKTCSRLTESNVKSNETRQHMITEAITKPGEQK